MEGKILEHKTHGITDLSSQLKHNQSQVNTDNEQKNCVVSVGSSSIFEQMHRNIIQHNQITMNHVPFNK